MSQPARSPVVGEPVYCCYIPDRRTLAHCLADEEIFEIILGPAPSDYTHACRAHLGELIDSVGTDGSWTQSTVRLAYAVQEG